TDILGTEVRDSNGRKLGRIADVRFILDGAPNQLLADARLFGVVVSPHSAASFLGYERYRLDQPWPLANILRWRHRGSFLVLWEDLARVGPKLVELRPEYSAYDPGINA